MKLRLKYMFVAGLLIGMTGCDDKLETFEMAGSVTAPTAIAASAVSSEALPGQIKLTWQAPAEGAYDYLQIKYYDPLAKQDVCKIASIGTTEMLIDDTRARFGDYSFYFQTFNAAHQGSAVTEVKAQSGAKPATYTEVSRTPFALTASQLSADQADSSEGQIANLVDGKTGTFYSSNWHGSGTTYPSYIQIDFDEPHENFAIEYVNRTDDTWREDGRPAVVELQVSNDGVNWTTVETLSGLPSKAASKYTSPYIMPGNSFTHFRFNVIAASGSASYFCFAELTFYDVEVDIYDPETVPLD